MSTVKELFEDAVKHEESILAHYIMFLLHEGKIRPEDDQSSIDSSLAYNDKFQNMLTKNILGFSNIKVYSLKQSKNRFVFIFAENPKEARLLYYRIFKETPLNCVEMSQDEVMSYGNRFMSFREIKREIKESPYYFGYYDRLYAEE